MKDNDDIAPIFSAKSDILQVLYGEFYISELVEAQNEDMKAIVLESSKSKRAVGFMNATMIYDAEFLNREYDLQSFNFLQKEQVLDKIVSSSATFFPKLQIDLPIAESDSLESKDILAESTTTSEKSQPDASLIAFREEVDPNLGSLIFKVKTHIKANDNFHARNFSRGCRV